MTKPKKTVVWTGGAAGRIVGAVFENKVPGTGKRYLTIEISKTWMKTEGTQKIRIKDPICINRKGLDGMIWVLEGIRD